MSRPRIRRTLSFVAAAAMVAALAVAVPASAGIDQDGVADLVFSTYQPNAGFPPNQVCEGDGAGNYACSDAEAGRYQTGGAAVGDVNGDGLPDVVFANQQFANRVCFGAPGGLGGCSPVPTPTGGTGAFGVYRDALVEDFDFDGVADILFVGGVPWPAYFVWGGTAPGVVDPLFDAATTPIDSQDVAYGDLTGDGRPDLLLPASHATSDRVNLVCAGDGTGVFDCYQATSHTENTTGVAIADIDGDGSLDGVFANWDQPNRVCWGPVSFPTGFPTCTLIDPGVNDKSNDVVVVDGTGSEPLIVFANGGADRVCTYDGAAFHCRPMSASTATHFEADVGDLDGDGDQDVILAGGGSEICLQELGAFSCSPGPNVSAGWYTGLAIVPSANEAETDLSLTSSVSNPTPRVGQEVRVSIVVHNDGDFDAPGIVVAPVLPAGLDYRWSIGGYDEASGTWSGDLAAGESTYFTLVTQAVAIGSHTATAEIVAAPLGDPDSVPGNGDPTEDDFTTVTIEIDPATSDLEVLLHADEAALRLDDHTTFTVEVANHGPDVATGVVLDIGLAGLVVEGANEDIGSYADGIWSLLAPLPAQDATYLQLSVRAASLGSFEATAEVMASDLPDPDSTPGNGDPEEDDQASIGYTVRERAADLSMTLDVEDSDLPVGSTAVFFVGFHNSGIDPSTEPTLAFVLPDGIEYRSDDSGGAYDPVSGLWQIPWEVDPGTGGSMVVEAEVLEIGVFDVTAQVVSAPEPDPDPSNDIASVTVTGLPVPPHLEVSLTYGTVYVNTRSPDTSFSVVVEDATGDERYRGTHQVGGEGWLGVDTGLCFEPGWIVTVVGTDTGVSADVTLVGVTVEALDPETYQVAGTAPAGAEVLVIAEGESYGRVEVPATAGSGGAFTATLPAEVGEGDYLQARVDDEDGSTTFAEVLEPASFDVSTTDGWIGAPGGTFRGDCAVAVTVHRWDGSLEVPTTIVPVSGGRFLYEGVPVLTWEGREVIVEGLDTGRTKTLRTSDLRWSSGGVLPAIDPWRDVVQGMARHPEVTVCAGNESDSFCMEADFVYPDYPWWIADLGAEGFDLTFDMDVAAFERDDDGDATVIESRGAGSLWAGTLAPWKTAEVVLGEVGLVELWTPFGGPVTITSIPADGETAGDFVILGHVLQIEAPDGERGLPLSLTIHMWVPWEDNWWEHADWQSFRDGERVPACSRAYDHYSLQPVPDPCWYFRSAPPAEEGRWLTVRIWTTRASEWFLGVPALAVGAVEGPLEAVPVGTAVEVSAPYEHLTGGEAAFAEWDWGDGAVTDGVIGPDHIDGAHAYDAPGVYTVVLTAVDVEGLTVTREFRYVVAYDPDGGFVTGGGWIESPAGADPAVPEAGGKAHFGFNAKYKKDSLLPEGQTQFRFGGLEFHSTAYRWLVVTPEAAKFRGIGAVNGEGGYEFIVTAVDGAPDTFWISIWDPDDGTVVYDNLIGSESDYFGGTDLGGGNVMVHRAK